MAEHYKNRHVVSVQNFELETLALFLSGIGVMLLVRQEIRTAYVQLIASVAGMIIFCLIIRFIENPDKIAKFRLPLMIFAVMLLRVPSEL